MSRRAWLKVTLPLLIASLALLSLLVIAVDPFQIYRLSTHFIPPIDNTTQVYSNAGLVRNYAYDSAIVGTSVTENFRPSYMEERLGGRFIKLCTSAGTLYNHALLLRLAFQNHEMARVVYGLDVYSMVGAPDKTGSPVPFYLYDDNPANDVAYWLNRSVLAGFLPRCLRTWGRRQDDSIRDTMYSWAGRDEYGPVALYNAQFTVPEQMLPAGAHLANGEANLKMHLLPFIEAHPETRFEVFFPPYSAAEWATMESRGTLEAVLALRSLAYDALSGYDNVTLYDFAAHADWVLDLSNYKDTTHYGAWINDAITDAIASGDGAVRSRAQLDAATRQLHAWADAQIAAGGWVY